MSNMVDILLTNEGLNAQGWGKGGRSVPDATRQATGNKDQNREQRSFHREVLINKKKLTGRF